MKRLTTFVVALAVPLFVAAMAAPGLAEEQPTLNIHGFGGWAAGYTGNDNLYPDTPAPIASHDLEVDNTYFTLNLLARPVEKVTILAQPTWQSTMRGREVRLDLAYVELNPVKDLRLRAGRIKNPLGLYMDIYKVGTLRPFYLLPSSYYRLAPESYSGLGANYMVRLGSSDLELDVLGGQMDFETSQSDIPVAFDPATGQPLAFGSIPVTVRGRDVLGGGAMLHLPVKGLKVGVSAYTMKLFGSIAGGAMEKLSTKREKAYAAAIEYTDDKVTLRAEGIMARGFEKDDCAYVEAAYYLTSHWQVAATYQYVNFKEPPPVVAQLSKDDTFGFGLNYWVNPKLVMKLDYYRATNNRTARPALDAVNLALAGKLEKDTDVLIGGVHFSF